MSTIDRPLVNQALAAGGRRPHFAEIARGEFAENTARKDFLPSEAVAIKRALEPAERKAAKKRHGARTDKHLGNLPRSSIERARDKAAAYTGHAARTLDKVAALVTAAETEPERFGKLVADMDRTGRVRSHRISPSKMAARSRRNRRVHFRQQVEHRANSRSQGRRRPGR